MAWLVATLAGLMACQAHARSGAPPPGTIAPDRYELVWADEFDRDGRPDSTKWTYELGFGACQLFLFPLFFLKERARVSS